jgi:hypothetical protein
MNPIQTPDKGGRALNLVGIPIRMRSRASSGTVGMNSQPPQTFRIIWGSLFGPKLKIPISNKEKLECR